MATKKEASIAAQNTQMIEIPALDIRHMQLDVTGDSSLIVHAWSDKAKKMILDKQRKKASAGREVRKPFVEFTNSLYWLTEKPDFDNMTDEEAQKKFYEVLPNAKFGFPTIAFKASAIDAAYQQGLVEKKTSIRGAIHIQGEFAEIEGMPTIREDMVKIGMGTADLRYRAEFKEWKTKLYIDYNARVISAEQIANFFNVGGFANGVGEWRPSKDGSFGTFHVG